MLGTCSGQAKDALGTRQGQARDGLGTGEGRAEACQFIIVLCHIRIMEGSCDPIHITYANVFRLGHLPEALTNIIVVSDIDTPFSIPRMPTQPKKTRLPQPPTHVHTQIFHR